MTTFEIAYPAQPQEKASAASENSTPDSGSFAKTLKALGLQKAKPDVAIDAIQHTNDPAQVTADEGVSILGFGDQSEVPQDEELNIETDLLLEKDDTTILNFSQLFTGIREHPKTSPALSDQGGGITVMEESGSEAVLTGEYSSKAPIAIGKSPENQGQGAPTGLGKSNKGNIPSVHFGQELSQGAFGEDIPLKQVSEKLNLAETVALGSVEPSKTKPTAELSKKVEGDQIPDLKTEKVEATNNDFFVKSLGQAEQVNMMQDDSASVKNQVIGSKSDETPLTKGNVSEGTQIDFEGEHLLSQSQKTVPQFEKGLVGQDVSKNSAEPTKIALPDIHSEETFSRRNTEEDSSIDPTSEDSNPVEALTLKNTSLPKVEIGKTALLKTEVLNLNTIKIPQNENEKKTSAVKTNKVSDTLLAKSSTETGLDLMPQKSLSAEPQIAESQEGHEGSGGLPDHSRLNGDFLKGSSLIQTSNLEVEPPVADMERTALGLAEKAAILSQVTEQFRVLRPGQLEQIRLRLHPESLGALQVEITLQKGAVVAHIITGDHLVKNLLEANQTLLSQSLAEQGFEVNGFSVDVGDADSGFKDRQTEHPPFANDRFNLQEELGPLGEVRRRSNVGEQGRINLYV